MAVQLPLGLKLPASARLDNFSADAGHTALAAVRRLVAQPTAETLYLAGAAATGKTHLLQAACRELQARERQAAYLPLREWRALTPDCLEGLEAFALVAVDDVDACAGDAVWEEALFHLFNRLREAQGAWLAAGRQSPEGAPFQLPDLRSRLGWGGVFVLPTPSDERIGAILGARARERGLELPAEVARYLLTRCTRDLSALLELLDRLDHAALAAQRRLTVPFVREALQLKTD